jgi:tetratricopeptide (TPR) repeat protein
MKDWKKWLSFVAPVVVLTAVLLALWVKERVGQTPAGHTAASFTPADLSPRIANLEARVAGKNTGPEKADLAALYVKQAKLTGDVTWYDKAEAMAKESLKASPVSNPRAKLALSETYEKRHLFAQSLQLAKEVLAELPSHPEALEAYATVNLAVGEIDEAIRAADLVVAIRPVSPYLTLKALTLNARGRDAEAEYYFRKAIEVEETTDPQGAAYTRTVYARFLITKGRYEQARTLLNEALTIVPRLPLALGVSTDLYLKQKQWDKAAAEAFEAFAASPQVSSLRKISRAKKMQGDERGAEDAMREAHALALKEIKSGVHAHPLELAYILTASKDPKDWQEAIRLSTEELKTRRSVLPYNALAAAQEKAGHLEAADQSIQTVLRTGIRNPDYYLLAAKIARRLGDIDRARFYYEAALAEDAHLTEAEDAIRDLRNQPKQNVARKSE